MMRKDDPSGTGLLFLAHRIPWPPNKGDKIRSYHLFQYLAHRYDVYLGTFVDDEADWRYTQELAALCRGSHFARLDAGRARWRSLQGLVRGAPLTLAYYRDRGLQRWVDGVLAGGGIRRVLVFSSAMAQYVMHLEATEMRRVVDFVDIDSDKWAQYSRTRPWPQRWLYGHEARALSHYERRVARAFDASVFVSAAEAALFRGAAPEAAPRVRWVRNGVDWEYFSPERRYGDPFPPGRRPLVFTGAMDYWPNVDAVDWFAREVLPAVRRRVPRAWFYIVGARPSAAVRRLASLPQVEVTGAVADVRPYLAHAHLVVAPLRVARGVQNKVLEAMAMARPLVATSMAMAGLEGVDEVACADSPAALAALVTVALERAGDGRPDAVPALRARVMRDYDWERNLHDFAEILEGRHEARGAA